MLLTLTLLSIVVFYMARLSPGDPLQSYYGDGVERMNSLEKSEAMNRLGLNEPIHVQYIKWVSAALHGDFGISYKYKQSVLTVIGDVYQNTLILGGLGYLITFGLALLLGVFCALHEDRWVDRLVCKAGVIANSIPTFWVALVLILIFSVNLKVLPSGGAYGLGKSTDFGSRMVHLILPITVLVLSHLWYYTYMVRNKLVEEMRQDYVLLCIVKGLTKRQIVYRHCLRNILPAYIGLMAISVPHLLGGTYVVEKVFAYPGLGTLCFESAKYHDYNTLMVLCLITGVVVVVVNMLSQVINEQIDPRMRCEKGAV